MVQPSKPNIYIVDDDPCIRDVISVFLGRAGYECSSFSGADHCLSMLRTHKCDLLITDVKMPVKDGIELLTEARSIFPWLPVLIITSYADVPLAVKALKAGADGLCRKTAGLGPLPGNSSVNTVGDGAF